jgi:hypothetical protein
MYKLTLNSINMELSPLSKVGYAIKKIMLNHRQFICSSLLDYVFAMGLLCLLIVFILSDLAPNSRIHH